MHYKAIFLVLLCSQLAFAIKFPALNLLKQEKSPYLKQHAENPIWWVPWNEQAFRWAKEKDKLVFLSIGYSSCHWCHVMEGDSFSKSTTAALLNKNYISIKVDRQERPDVDAHYMKALLAIKGSGGWPMTLILTPDRKPVFADTFVERERLEALLKQVNSAWKDKKKRSSLLAGSKKLSNFIHEDPLKVLSKEEKASLSDQSMKNFFMGLKDSYDGDYGGFSGPNRFPEAMILSTLLRIHRRTDDKRVLPMVNKTLESIARKGLHDHVGGGFFRYTVDHEWQKPHFEKMLYDNAMLAVTFLEAFQVTGKQDYKVVVTKTLKFLSESMANKQGGFFSALDADTEKTEGKFYLWTNEELKSFLTVKELKLLREFYGIKPEGNLKAQISMSEKKAGLKILEKGNHLVVQGVYSLESLERGPLFRVKNKLLERRLKKTRPFRDENILSNWNGLTIVAFAKAYQVFRKPEYLNIAKKAMNYLLKSNQNKGELVHSSLGGRAGSVVYLEDYAAVVWALIEIYQCDFNPRWYLKAKELQDLQTKKFLDTKTGVFFDNEVGGTKLLIANRKLGDEGTPSGHSLTVLNLLQLSGLSYDKKYSDLADKILRKLMLVAQKKIVAYPFLLQALDYSLDQSKEIAITGNPDHPDSKKMVATLQQHFIPSKVIANGIYHEKTNPLPLLKHKPLLMKKMVELLFVKIRSVNSQLLTVKKL